MAFLQNVRKLAMGEEHREKLALIQHYVSQKQVLTRDDLRIINAYLGGDHAQDTVV